MGTKSIDINPQDQKLLLSLIEQFLPHTRIWAYGSRIQGRSRPWSDLDLAAFTRPDQHPQVCLLREALEESDLSFQVDLLEWASLPEDFQKNIAQEYAVLTDKE